jgi:hypothetical protein
MSFPMSRTTAADASKGISAGANLMVVGETTVASTSSPYFEDEALLLMCHGRHRRRMHNTKRRCVNGRTTPHCLDPRWRGFDTDEEDIGVILHITTWPVDEAGLRRGGTDLQQRCVRGESEGDDWQTAGRWQPRRGGDWQQSEVAAKTVVSTAGESGVMQPCSHRGQQQVQRREAGSHEI